VQLNALAKEGWEVVTAVYLPTLDAAGHEQVGVLVRRNDAMDRTAVW